MQTVESERLAEGEAGDNIMQLRVGGRTRTQYNTMLAHFARWLRQNHPSLVQNDAISLPIPPGTCQAYLSFVSIKRNAAGVELAPVRHNSFSTINGYKSTIKFLYTERKCDPSPELESTLKHFANGYKRHVAQLKEDGEIPMTEGKSPMSQEGYKFLALHAAANGINCANYAYVHCFLLFSWNLMARAASVASIRFDHLSWEGDALLVRFGRMKNDQDGSSCLPRHVYANPRNPSICAVLSLAVLVFSKGSQRDSKSTLVFGANAKERFSAWVVRTCELHRDTIMGMGLSINDVGTHSFRKGVSTALSNTPGGPESVAVWLRAGWSLGSVQKRYIFAGAGGDQHVGRAAAGLNMNSIDFAVLPPHFAGSVLSISEWEAILPCYQSFYPSTFRCVLPFLLASIVHHHDWLRDTLHASHPLFVSLLWTSGIVPSLSSKVHLGSMSNPATTMSATGIPPHVSLGDRLSKVEAGLSSLTSTIETGLASLAGQLSASVAASTPPTPAGDMNWSLIDRRVDQRVESIVRSGASMSRVLLPSDAAMGAVASIDDSLTWTWGGRFHNVPEGFRLPTGKVNDLWNLWWLGIPAHQIGPIRHLRSWDLARAEAGKLSKARHVISTLLTCSSLSTVHVERLQMTEILQLFRPCFLKASQWVYGSVPNEDSKRKSIDDMSYITFYGAIKSKQKE